MEEGRQIDQEVCGEFERAGDMVHGLLYACHRSSVGNGLAVDKGVSHGSLPIFAHYVTRWSPRVW